MNNLLIRILDGLNSLAAGAVMLITVGAGLLAFTNKQEGVGLALMLGGPAAAAILFGITATLLDIRHQLVELNRKQVRVA